MKKLNYILFALLTFAVFTTSCSNDDDTQSSAKAILKFKVDDIDGVINETAKTVNFVFPFGTKITELTPTITVSEKATISPASETKVDLTNPVKYTVKAENGSTQEYTVSATIEASTATDIQTFSFDALTPKVIATIDAVNNTISATVPNGTNVAALVPTISHLGASISPASDATQDFTQPVKYTVTAADGTTKKEYTVTVAIAKAYKVTKIEESSIKNGESINILGSFEAAGNKVELKNVEGTVELELEVTSQSESKIVGKLNADIADGEYLVYVTTGGSKLCADPYRVVVENSTNPEIISLDKAKYTIGLDAIRITGINLADKMANAEVHLRKEGSTSSYITVKSKSSNNQTSVVLSNPYLDKIQLGKHVLYVIVDGVKSNEVEFEVVANTNPIPTITSICPLNPVKNCSVNLNGTNLGSTFDTSVRIYSYTQSGQYILWTERYVSNPNANGTYVSFIMPELIDKRFRLQIRSKGQLSNISEEYTMEK